ncbi:CheR family methyltransferase [Rhodohalobacter sp. 8-1]|uniref:CheR family methyltransferase n=1 Tax=Rhodohalobacter sp. 8-1 TaxID=3131972 RepID=UPI0030EDA3BE
MSSKKGASFLQWALPKMGYRWDGFRKPRNQVLSRIRDRIQDLGLAGGFDEYKRYLDNHPEEWDTLDQLCDVTISKFFRDRKVWDYLRDEALPGILNDEPASIWSVGCCNGEEAYSLAIICKQLAEKTDRNITSNDINILATDRNEQVLSRARKGCYPAGALKELTDDEISTYFRTLDDKHEDDYQIEERLKKFVDFEKRDIQDSLPDQTFDLILCRNLVFTYFTEERQAEFLDNLKPRMKKPSYLVIGSNESLPKPGWLDVVSETHRVFGV